MNIFKILGDDLKKIYFKLYDDKEIWRQTTLETPKDPLNGDVSTNVAMLIASKNGGNPREIALKFKEFLNDISYVAHVEVAGPGFINFTIKAERWHQCVDSILNDDEDFWQINVGEGKKINVEYVSANPTGPMHIGHARGAVYGDVLANMLNKCGWDVTKEYYVNDAGAQIDLLVDSLLIRYREALTGKKEEVPEGMYPGDYLMNLGKKLAKSHKDYFMDGDTRLELKKIAINEMLKLIKADLEKLGVKHDVFTSEQKLHNDKKIDEVVESLKKMDLIYKGTLPPPKGKIDENWQEKEQILFKSSNYGDDQDRPIQKSDGSWSYLAADFALAKDKIDRGFESLVYILGADHGGYVKRIKAVIAALSNEKVESNVKISQLVNFVKDGKPLKMSKRNGNFMTVSDVIADVNKDIIRFIMLTRRNDMSLDFDFAKVKEQSKDNPVFYVQYAHVRTASILAKAKETNKKAYDKFMAQDFKLGLLDSEEEIQLIKILASWPKILASAAVSYEPQKIAYYLIDVASRFHAIWNLGKEDNNYRFNIDEKPDLTASRLAFTAAIGKILRSGFEVMGITPLEKM